MQRCPDCDEVLGIENVNIKEGVGLCQKCQKLWRLSEVVFHDRPLREMIEQPPEGCSVESTMTGSMIRVSLRSWGSFIGTLFICLFWNAIVSVFVCIAFSGLYANLIGDVPNWFPAPVMNDEKMSLGMTLFLCLFLTPFVTIGSIMFGAMILSAAGRLEILIDGANSYVSTGVGSFCWKRRFNAEQVTAIQYKVPTVRNDTDTNTRQNLEIVADRSVTFGSHLPDNRKEWLEAILRHLLIKSRQ